MHSYRSLALLSLLVIPGVAPASGYYYSDSGIVATSRGGAFVAGADNQFAQQYNPAGLVRMKAPTLNLGWSGVQQKVSFSRTDANGDPTTVFCASGAEGCDPTKPEPTAENQAKPFNVPQLGFAMPFDVKGQHFGFAFGFISPFAPSAKYAPKGAQRYSIIDTGIYQGGFGPSLAWQPIKQLMVGAGFQWSFLDVRERLSLSLNGQDNGSGDIDVQAAVTDKMTPTWNAGIIVEPIEQLAIGLSITPGATYRGRGDLSVEFDPDTIFAGLIVPPGECEDPTDTMACPRNFTDNDIGLIINLPTVLRAGIAVRPTKKLEIEGAIVWQNMSSIGACPTGEVPLDPDSDSCGLIVEDIDLEIASTLDPDNPTAVDNRLSLPAFLEDAFSYRLGAEYDDGPWAVRLGGFYEQSALLPERVSVTLYDTDKIQLGGGASIRLLDERLSFDTSFAWIFFDGLKIRESKVEQTVIDSGLFPLPSETPVVGNGNYSSSGYIIGIQTSWAFAKPDHAHADPT